MHQFTTVQAERLCHLPARELDRRKDRNTLPFPAPRRTRYAKQHYTPAQLLLLLIQDQVRDKWHVSIGEAAWCVRQVNLAIAQKWEMVCRDGWLVRQAKAEGAFDHWLTNSAGVLELVDEATNECSVYQWSAEALAAESEMRARGASDVEIQKVLMALEGGKLAAWHKAKQQTLWLLNIPQVIVVMEETAADMGFALPPREDRAAWFGTDLGGK